MIFVDAEIVSVPVEVTAEIIGLTIVLSMYSELEYTGVIDNSNVTFVCTTAIDQIFKGGALMLNPSEYTLSVDRKTATMVTPPNDNFGDILTFFGNEI